MGLKNLFEKMEPAFLPGGKYAKIISFYLNRYLLCSIHQVQQRKKRLTYVML